MPNPTPLSNDVDLTKIWYMSEPTQMDVQSIAPPIANNDSTAQNKFINMNNQPGSVQQDQTQQATLDWA